MADVLFDIPWARGQRQREVHALTEDGKGCRALYDVERRRVVSVPLEYAWHMPDVVRGGGLIAEDNAAAGWLASQDILTWDEEPLAQARTHHLDLARSGDVLGWVSHENGVVHCRLPGMELPAELLTGQWLGGPGSKVVLHLDLGDFDTPARVASLVRTGSKWGDTTEREVTFLLSGSLSRVSALPADLLRRAAVRARVVGCPLLALSAGSDRDGDARLEELVEQMEERLTVQVDLEPGSDLLAVWRWAESAGVRRLDVARLESAGDLDSFGPSPVNRRHRRDLEQICQEMFWALRDQRPGALLFVPVLRVLQKQRVSTLRDASQTMVALTREGQPVPVQTVPSRPRSVAVPPVAGDAEESRPGAAAEERCAGCWARNLCSSSAFAATSEGPRAEPQADRCERWQLEIAAALRLYARLREDSPRGVHAVPVDLAGAEVPEPSTAPRSDPGGLSLAELDVQSVC